MTTDAVTPENTDAVDPENLVAALSKIRELGVQLHTQMNIHTQLLMKYKAVKERTIGEVLTELVEKVIDGRIEELGDRIKDLCADDIYGLDAAIDSQVTENVGEDILTKVETRFRNLDVEDIGGLEEWWDEKIGGVEIELQP
jgi:hypothetical protein